MPGKQSIKPLLGKGHQRLRVVQSIDRITLHQRRFCITQPSRLRQLDLSRMGHLFLAWLTKPACISIMTYTDIRNRIYTMPGLFIRDEAVNALAVEAMKLTGAENKTEAVRAALNAAIAAAKDQVPLLERLEAARILADKIGPVDAEYDAKADADAMWGDA